MRSSGYPFTYASKDIIHGVILLNYVINSWMWNGEIDVGLVQLLYHLEIDFDVVLSFQLEWPGYSGLESRYSSHDVWSPRLHIQSFWAVQRMWM